MPFVRTNPNYLKTYLYLVDPKEGGKAQVAISKLLGISKSTVSSYVQDLLGEGFIRKVKGSKSPQLYEKGSNSTILDRAILEARLQIDGGTVKATESSQLLSSDNKLFVPTSRTHINGRVRFNVIKPGDLRELRVQNDGTTVRIPLFPKDPYNRQHNTLFWKTKIPWQGEQVSLEYQESHPKGGETSYFLSIWPKPKKLVPDQFHKAEEIMITEAQRIANVLSKHGGWEFGLVELTGDMEHASRDPVILGVIPEDMKAMEGSPFWIDESKGAREIETKDPEAARLLFDFPNVVRNLDNNQKATMNRTYVLEMRVDKLLEIVEKIGVILERDANNAAILAEHRILDTSEKALDQKRKAGDGQETNASLPDRFDGGMYR